MCACAVVRHVPGFLCVFCCSSWALDVPLFSYHHLLFGQLGEEGVVVVA